MSSMLWPALLQEPVLAQVDTPAGSGYVSSAVNHHGYLLQRRYVGVGAPHQLSNGPDALPGDSLWDIYHAATPALWPVVNPGAVQAAGLDFTYVTQQAAHLGVHLLAHPTFGPLCLRWGPNAHGYHVFPVPYETPSSARTVFTPYTDWASGQTYYQLASGLPISDAIMNALTTSATHAWRPAGVGGGQPGWYATDALQLEQFVAAAGQALTLQQLQGVYTVTVEEAPDAVVAVWQFFAAEAARGWYTHLANGQGGTSTPVGVYPRLAWHTVARVDGQVLTHDENEACELSAQQVAQLPTSVEISLAWSSTPMPIRFLTDADQPLNQLVPTMDAVLSGVGLPLADLAVQIGMSLADLQGRQRDPSQWRLAELRRLAQATGQPVATLADLVEQQLRW